MSHLAYLVDVSMWPGWLVVSISVIAAITISICAGTLIGMMIRGGGK